MTGYFNKRLFELAPPNVEVAITTRLLRTYIRFYNTSTYKSWSIDVDNWVLAQPEPIINISINEILKVYQRVCDGP